MTPIAVEIIERKPDDTETAARLLTTVFLRWPLMVTLTWWFFAAWFPQLGITWWALVLPVVAFRVLISRDPAPKNKNRRVIQE